VSPGLEKAVKTCLTGSERLLREIGHTVPHTPETERLRWLVEFAGAFTREAWIAADGQDAATPDQVAQRCSQSMRLFQKLSEGCGVDGHAMTSPSPAEAVPAVTGAVKGALGPRHGLVGEDRPSETSGEAIRGSRHQSRSALGTPLEVQP